MIVEVAIFCFFFIVLVVTIGIGWNSGSADGAVVRQGELWPSVPIAAVAENRVGDVDVDFFCISMEHRQATHYKRLKDMMQKEGLTLQLFTGINGKTVDRSLYNLAPRYKTFFDNNDSDRSSGKANVPDYRGHLGATLSHLSIIRNAQRMTVILEDDAELVPDFRAKFEQALRDVEAVDPSWEVLKLGFCCRYGDSHSCKLNDVEPIHPGGIVKLHYWFGGWGYCVRNQEVAQKIMRAFDPISWHIDLSLAEEAEFGRLNVYGVVPTLTNHAGWLRISSFDYNQNGDPKFIKTDTNH